MIHDTATLILAIIGAVILWTTSVIACMIWLTGKFRSLEAAIYREAANHKAETDKMYNEISRRVQRIELHSFGFTASGPTVPPP